MAYVLEFLKALGLTLLIELPLLLEVVTYLFKEKNPHLNTPRLLATGTLATFSTLPYLWFVLPELINNYFLFLVVGEISVTLLESFIYTLALHLKFKNALLLSIICNLLSFGLGLLIR